MKNPIYMKMFYPLIELNLQAERKAHAIDISSTSNTNFCK